MEKTRVNKQRIISIVMLLISAGLIIFGITLLAGNNSNENNSKLEILENNDAEPPLMEALDYNSAYDLAVSLYEYDGRIVELEEQEQDFVIYVKNSDGIVLNVFNINKETGDITEGTIEDSESEEVG